VHCLQYQVRDVICHHDYSMLAHAQQHEGERFPIDPPAGGSVRVNIAKHPSAQLTDIIPFSVVG